MVCSGTSTFAAALLLCPRAMIVHLDPAKGNGQYLHSTSDWLVLRMPRRCEAVLRGQGVVDSDVQQLLGLCSG